MRDRRALRPNFLGLADFEAYLADSTYHGGGAFSVDRLHRARQLRDLQIQSPYLWLLRLIQAATAGEAAAVALEVRPHLISLEFGLADVSSDDLAALQAGSSPSTGCAKHLDLALNLALASAATNFTCRLTGAGRQLCWSGAEGKLAVDARDSIYQSGLSFQWNRKVPPIWRPGLRARLVDEVVDLIERRFAFAPVQITCNGRVLPLGQLDSVYKVLPPSSLRGSSRYGKLRWLVASAQPDHPGISISPTAEELVFEPGSLFSADYRFQNFTALHLVPREPCKLLPVWDGLSLGLVSCAGPKGGLTIVASPEWKVDAGFSKVVRDAHWQTQVDLAALRFAELGKQARELIDRGHVAELAPCLDEWRRNFAGEL